MQKHILFAYMQRAVTTRKTRFPNTGPLPQNFIGHINAYLGR
jgi:hypothetical protein